MEHLKVAQYLASLSAEADQSLKAGAGTDLGLLVDDLSDICNQLVSDQAISFAASSLFHPDSGLLSLVDRLRISRERSVHKAREKCLALLSDFVTLIGRERALIYASFIKDNALRILRVDETRSVQAAALAPLIALFEIGVLKEGSSDAVMDWKIAEVLLGEFRKAKTSGSLKSNILVTLGYSVEFFPSRFQEDNVSSIVKLCLNTLEEQLKQSGRDVVFVVIAGAMKCLDSLLQWFDETVPAGGTVDNSRKSYAYLEQVIYYREDMKRYEMIRAGLRLLARHGWRFRLALFKNCTDILSWLEIYCTHSNASLRSAALPAYDQFISQISSCLVSEDQRVENLARTYTSLMKHFLGIMDSRTDHPKLVSLAIRAVGKLSPAVVKYSGKDDLEKAFQRLVPFAGSYTRGGDTHEELGYAVTVVGAFANMVVYLERVEDFMVSLITEVTGRIFYQFPSLFPKQKPAVYTTISSLFKAVYVKGSLFTMFLLNVVWSSLERAIENGDAYDNLSAPIWKSYAELWCQLLDYVSVSEHHDPLSDDEECSGVVGFELGIRNLNHKELQSVLFSTLIRGIMKSLTELNLKYRVKPSDKRTSTETSEQDLEPEVETIIEPLDKNQMLKYLNLVEFVLYLFTSDHGPLMVDWIFMFSSCIIDLSRKYPLISGFYKLLAAVIVIGDREGYFDKQASIDGSYSLIKEFLLEVVTTSRRYKLELLASCLRLCLSCPPTLLDLVSILRPLKLALKLGLRYSPLANIALDALQRWHVLYPLELKKHLHEVVPCLGDYLYETTDSEIKSIDAKTLKVLKEEKTKIVTFQAIQVRVQQFLGKTGSFGHFLVPDINVLQASGTGGLAWDVVERVKFTLPLRDEKLDVCLDCLLPRIVELATSSSDRKTKVMASELFHAVCLLMLGNSAKGPLRSRSDGTLVANYVQIYKKLFPAVLRLATDAEQVNQQLYSEFSMQLIHWMTSNTQKENPETMALLDAILDGLVDADNGSLREFCALCFCEFLRWSIRHAPPEASNFVNVASMLRRLYNRMDHPNPYHRLGASMAAFQIYPILRENSAIVDRHIFEITFFLVKSLRVGDADVDHIGTKKQVSKALNGIQRLISRNISLLQKNRNDRVLFLTLEDFMDWLFRQTMSDHESCRAVCMELLASVCVAVPGGSCATWFRERHDPAKRSQLLSSLFNKFRDDISSTDDLSKFSTAVHWLQWSLSSLLINLDELGTMQLPIYSKINRFIENLLARSASSRAQDKAIVHMLAVVKVVLQLGTGLTGPGSGSVQDGRCRNVLAELLPVNFVKLQQLFCLLLFQPTRFMTYTPEIKETEELRVAVCSVLWVLSHVSAEFRSGLIKVLQDMLSEFPQLDIRSLELDQLIETKLSDSLNLIKAYEHLHTVGVLSLTVGKASSENLGRQLLLTVYNVKSQLAPVLEPLLHEMLQLSVFLGVGADQILELVLDKRGATAEQGVETVTPGRRFYLCFRKLVVHQIKFFYKKCVAALLKESVRNDTARLLLHAVLDEYQQGDTITKGSFVNEFLVHLEELRPCYLDGSTVTDKQYLISIIHKLLLLDKKLVLSDSQPSFQFILHVMFTFLSSNSLDGAVLRNHALGLVPFMLEPSVDVKLHSRLFESLTTLVTCHLLVRESDLPAGSNQRSHYLKTLNLVIGAVISSRNLNALEVLFPFLQNPTDLTTPPISEALRDFAENVGDQRAAAFNFCLEAVRDATKLTRLRKAIMDYVFVPLICSSPPQDVAEWFVQRIGQLMDALGRQIASPDVGTEQESLFAKINSYILVELLFTQVPGQLIKDRITPLVSNQQVMKLASNDCRGKNDPKVYVFDENVSFWRDLHVSAYTCLAAVVMCTQTQEKIFTVLFKDGGGNPLWQHLIDCSKVYSSFPVQTSTLGEAHAIVKGIRADIKGRRGRRLSASMTLSSQYLVGMSMSQEPTVISSFVGGNSMASLPSAEEEQVTVVEQEVKQEEESVVELAALDQDDFDQHPCMGVLLRLIEHLVSKFGGGSSHLMPEWMKSLHATLDNSSTHPNIRLFLGKVVIKARKVFAPFSGSFFQPLANVILLDPQSAGGRSFHYFLRDISITVLQWEVKEPAETFTASRFINHLIAVAAHESSQVLKANVEIIKAFIDLWKGRVSIDGRGILNYFQAAGKTLSEKQLAIQKSVGLQLLGAAVASSASFTEALDGLGIAKEEIFDVLMNNMKVKSKAVYMASAEVLGMAFKEKGDSDLSALENRFKQLLLGTFKEGDYSKCLHLMDRLSYQFAAFVGSYAHLLIDLLPKLHGVSKSTALDILLRNPECVISYFNMLNSFISKLLQHRDAKAQLKSLQLLTEVVKKTADQSLIERVTIVICDAYEHYEAEECRLQLHQLLMFLYETNKVPHEARINRFLIMGLSDSSDIVRQKLQTFWDAQLPENFTERFNHIVNKMHIPDFEAHWTQFTNVLLFKLCRRSVDYERPIFNAPLSDCEFFERQVDSALRGSLPMTPLFSETASLRSNRETQVAESTPSLASVSIVNHGRGGMIRATVAYSPATLTMFEGSEESASQTQGFSAEGSQSSGVVVDPQTKLKRRLFYPKDSRSNALKYALNTSRKRKAQETSEVLHRANKVQIMRQYRTGELPDIEIKHEDIIGPISSLAERDATFARLVLSMAFGTFWQKDVASNIRSSVRTGLEAVLENTSNDSTLVGTIQDLCLKDKELWIKAKVVGNASLKSQNFHSGILLLEKEILHGCKPVPSTTKRHKGVSGEVSPDNAVTEEAWLELAHLYKAIGESDFVLSLYQNRLTNNALTHQALECQIRQDVDRALMLYDKAIEGGNASKLEEELWYNQRLACLVDLNQWTDVMEDALLQVQKDNTDDYDLEKFWHPRLQDPYLGLFVKGSLKVPAHQSLLTDFFQKSLEDGVKRNFLLQHFGTHLATTTIINDETDRARYYIGECYNSFRRKWSVLHPLATGARKSQVSFLQKTVELEEFLEFSMKPDWSKIPSLLGEWRQRWPSFEKDDVEAWDDILRNRLLFFQKLQQLFNKQQDAADQTIAQNFTKQLDTERASGFYEAARGVMKRGAYSVAQKYMNEYMAVNQRVAEKGSFNSNFFKRLVKLRCLQAFRVQETEPNTAVTMLEQVLDYVQSTARKPSISDFNDRSKILKLVESDVSAQLGRTKLEVLLDGENMTAMEQCLSLFGSAFQTYTELLDTDDFTSLELAKSSFKFACFCDTLLKASSDTKWSSPVRSHLEQGRSIVGLPPASAFPQVIVANMLRSLAIDSSIRPEHAVSRVLSLVGEHKETHTTFLSQAGKVPCWIFLGWLPQILALMDKEEGELFIKIVENIADQYPHALYFPFQVSKAEYGEAGTRRTARLASVLKNPVLEGLSKALEDLTFPEKRLYDGLSQIKSCLTSGKHAQAQQVFQQIYRDCLDVNAMREAGRQSGDYNLKFAKDYSKAVLKVLGDSGNKLLQMDENKFATAINGVLTNLQKVIRDLPGGKLSLSSFSKWMADFDQLSTSGRTEIEIPGQYAGFQKPHVDSHVTLVGFDQTLVALSSKQRPKILTMRGSDEREYKFIVKGGEDLRLDQRIEQLFSVMNSVLKQDPSASQRKLAMTTYSVIPVSTQCGLLQFVENTCVLEDVIKDGMSSQNLPAKNPKRPASSSSSKNSTATDLLNSLRAQYHQWVEKKGSSKILYECYRNLYTKVKPKELQQLLSSLNAQLPMDALKTGLYKRTTSAESFLTIRSQFAKSLAVTSICGYVAGVGDRHLANTLIDMKTGSLVSIDFGYSFGTGVILLPVPELIPFRLTPQLTNVLLPLDSHALLKYDMVRALSALHKNRDVITAVMDVFVKEPLVDWKTEAARAGGAMMNKSKAQCRNSEDYSEEDEVVMMQQQQEEGEQEHVELKVENARRKLEMWNPAAVTVAELERSVHAGKDYFGAMVAAVRGDGVSRKRSSVKRDVCASVEEQVECLVDQATDPALLARLWVGWQPWV